MMRIQSAVLRDLDDKMDVEIVNRSAIREYLIDGTMTREDVRRRYRDGFAFMSGTGGAMPQYGLATISYCCK